VNGTCLVLAVLAWLVGDGRLDSSVCGLILCLSGVRGHKVTNILTLVIVARLVLDY